MKKIAASDSRQSVGLKWKTRKGLENLIDFDGDKTIIGGLTIDKLGNVEMGKNAAVDGTLTLNTPQNLIFKTGSINPIPEGYAVDDAGNVTIAGALTANNNGDVQVGKNLEVDGKAKFGYTGKATFNTFGTPMDYFVHEAVFKEGDQVLTRFVAFLPIVDNVSNIPVIKDIYGFLINNSDGTPATTIEEALNGVLGDIPFTLALNGEWNSAEFGELRVYSGKILLSADSGEFVDLRLINTASQAKYQHTVTLHGDGFEFCFTAMSSKETPVSSYQDLVTVFGGCRIVLTGFSAALAARSVYIDLHGGTVATDFIRVYNENGGGFSNKTLSSIGTIIYEDDVCIPK